MNCYVTALIPQPRRTRWRPASLTCSTTLIISRSTSAVVCLRIAYNLIGSRTEGQSDLHAGRYSPENCPLVEPSRYRYCWSFWNRKNLRIVSTQLLLAWHAPLLPNTSRPVRFVNESKFRVENRWATYGHWIYLPLHGPL
jgi:hypothetical protein